MAYILRDDRAILAVGTTLVLAVLVVSGFPTAGAAPHPPVGSPYTWHLVSTTNSPGPRNRCGFAYDAADGYVVMYGGYDYLLGQPFYNDTWSYAGGVWTNLNLSVHPTAPSGFQMAYFPPLHGVVLFGGEGPFGSAYYNDTWLFHAGKWTLLHPKHSPPVRSQYAMAYDAADQELILFGGYKGSTAFQDTWAFNGKTWKQVVPIIAPEGRTAETLVYDSITHQMLMYGGSNSSYGTPPGTWAFKGGAWRDLPFARTPSRIYTPATAFPNGTPVFFGGLTNANGTVYNSSYEFYGASWHAVSFGHPPAPRELGGFAYDATDAYLVYFGGNDNNILKFYNDTLALY